MELDAASFKTEIDSTSSGFRLFIFPSIPSINTKVAALEPCDMVPVPRMLISSVCPNSPPRFPTDRFRPGTVPCRDCPKLVTGRESSILVSTVATASVRLAFLWVPNPTTTTSSNVWVSSSKEIEYCFSEVILISLV